MNRMRGIVTVLLVVLPALLLAVDWHMLPERVPVHFGFDGRPDGWGSKAVLWFLPATAVLLLVLLRGARGYPQLLNLPRPVGHPDRARWEALVFEMFGWLQVEIALLFAYILWTCIQVALSGEGGLSKALLPLIVAALVLNIGATLYRGYKGAPAV